MPYSLPYIYIRGRVTQGRGESADYLKKDGYRNQFREKLDIDPVHGTLNLKLDDDNEKNHKDITWHEGVWIEGFEEDGEVHGAAEVYPAEIRGVKCAVVIPEERETYRIMEVVANTLLRDHLYLEEGDIVDVKVFVDLDESWL